MKSNQGGIISKRQISKIYPGTLFINRKFEDLRDNLIKKHKCCIACGSKESLEPHHIIPSNTHDRLFYDKNNIAILCRSCHDKYHQNYFPINDETFNDFLNNFTLSKTQKRKMQKSAPKYKRKKYERSKDYSKIRINDFREKKTKKVKGKSRRKRKIKRLNPIFLTKPLGCDDWEYIDKINLEKEVLGDYN